MSRFAANKSGPLKLGFAAKSATSWMAERARGLSRHLSPDIQTLEYYHDTTGLLGTWRCFRELFRGARYLDVIYLISMHPVRLLAVFLGRLFYSTRIILDTGDILYEEAKTRGDPWWKCLLISLWESICLRVPDALVVRGSYHKELLQQQGFADVTFIPDGVDCSAWDSENPKRDQRLREELGLAGKVVLGIMSGIAWEPHLRIPSPGWDLVACLVRLRDMPLHGLVIGDGPGLPHLKKLCRVQSLEDRVTFVGRIPYDRIPDYLGVIDIVLHTALNNKMSEVRTTGKLPMFLASGRTLIASAVGEARRVLKDSGMLLPFDDGLDVYGESLARHVAQLVKAGDFNRICALGQEIARREFDYHVLALRLYELVRTLAS